MKITFNHQECKDRVGYPADCPHQFIGCTVFGIVAKEDKGHMVNNHCGHGNQFKGTATECPFLSHEVHSK
jgi:hypothetical protein